VKRLSYRYQRTIGHSAQVRGIGLLTGASVCIHFHPAPPSTGIVFIRTDLHPRVLIPARVEQVSGTQRRTTLGQPPAHVALVEHVLAALAGLRIDNCYVELNAAEPPGLDGSSQGFVEVLWEAGALLQPARRGIWGVEESVVVRQRSATLTLHPPEDDNELKISYLLDFGLGSSIGRQVHTQVITPESFAGNIAGCRTFILEEEVAELRRQGLGARTTTADLLVFGSRGPVNNRLRFANEPARHKVLDVLGDLSLLGQDLRGHLVACRSGHPLNVELVRLLSDSIADTSRIPCLAA
jgi:UDP-3-O-[3-hydroxymyristoyl] N-acetylglucosamine deacetylase